MDEDGADEGPDEAAAGCEGGAEEAATGATDETEAPLMEPRLTGVGAAMGRADAPPIGSGGGVGRREGCTTGLGGVVAGRATGIEAAS